MTSKPPRHADQLRQVLEEEIASNHLAPGARLEEVALAERFGVSRTPIREALQMLSASGLVELRPRRSAIVAALSLELLLEMFETMAEMESICGRLAARRMNSRERKELKKQHEVCGKAGEVNDRVLYYEENVRFHGLIYAGSHNKFLTKEVKNLQRRLQAYRRLQLNISGRMNESYAEHTAITDAIFVGDEEMAGRLLRGHVSVQGNRFGDWLSNLSTAQLVTDNMPS
ncbi:MAG: GntR family transcriptional regulator [bacterium]|nr:GntR family transcriptional regulator [bacterium]